MTSAPHLRSVPSAQTLDTDADLPSGTASTPRRAVAAVIGAVVATSVVGGEVQRRRGAGAGRRWYDGLRKPPGQPPSWLFAPVWTVLYAGIAWTGVRLWRSLDSAARKRARRLWIAQMVANAAWTPLFFGLRRPLWALADQVALDTFAVQLRKAVGPVEPSTTVALDAYLAWLSYATYLNAGICVLNR